MNFEFSDEQNLLREQALGFLQEQCPYSAVRAILDGESHPTTKNSGSRSQNSAGPPSSFPRAHGGLGLSYLELCVIAEELGRAVAPVPFSSSVYLATEAILMAGTEAQKEKWLPKLATGEAIGAFALGEGPGQPRPRETGHSCNRQWHFRGQDSGGGRRRRGLRRRRGESRYRRRCQPVSRGTRRRGARDGRHAGSDPVACPDQLRRRRRRNRSAPTAKDGRQPSACSTGPRCCSPGSRSAAPNAALEMAKAYALERYAFGRPIASYQAIKHKLAQAYVKNTLARANCYYGAWALDPPMPTNFPPPQRPPGSAPRRRTTSHPRRTSRPTAAWASPGSSTASSTTDAPSCCRSTSAAKSTWQDKLISAIERERDGSAVESPT